MQSLTFALSRAAKKAKGEPKAKKEKATKKEAKEKKAPTAYNYFMKVSLPKFKKANPDYSHQDAVKEVAAKWSVMSKDQKARRSCCQVERHAFKRVAAKWSAMSKDQKAYTSFMLMLR